MQIEGTKNALKLKPLRKTLLFYTWVMLLTPTFQVYLGDIFGNTNPRDIFAESVAACCLIAITVVYQVFLEEVSPAVTTAVALLVQIISYCLSIVVFSFNL
jgi:glucan phosphoethanolaminetransferase (alkaline phosphatase superfamily)